MVNFLFDCYQILNKVYSDKAFLKQAINDTIIEEKNRAMTVKTVYGVLDRDIELSYYISKLCDKNPKLVIRTILKISFYLIKYMEKQVYAVTKNAVELTKKLGKGGMSGFVNAIIRKFIKEDIAFPKDKIECLSVKYSYPIFAVKNLINDYGEKRAEDIMASENKKTTLVFYGTDGQKYLSERGVEYSSTQFENVFSCDRFRRDEGYDRGEYTFQALGSVAICDGVSKCEKLLDCCSAPGGKSVRLSYKCNEVTSWDIHEHRVALIDDYKKRMNRSNITTCVKDAKVFDDSLCETFDGVLVDAPCSGFGVVNDNPDMKLFREEQSLDELNKEQLAIMKTVSGYVKKGGYLYYSTCSIFARENIAIIDRFMSEVNGFEIEKTESKLPCVDIKGTLQFTPDISYGLGFYFAKLKRIK